jgi:hypothetical protein
VKHLGSCLLPLVTLFACGNAFAQTSDIATQLVKEMRYGQAFDDAQAECLNRATALNVEALLADSPDLFGDITPADKFWPEAEELYKELVRAGCRNYDKGAAERAFAAELSENLSPSEQQKILEFYQSSLGQSFIRASIKANDAANHASSPDINSNDAYKAYERGLEELLIRRAKEPRARPNNSFKPKPLRGSA